MNVDDKDNAIASAELAGLYYSSNSEPGNTRQIKEEEHIFLDTNGKPLKGKREIKRIENEEIDLIKYKPLLKLYDQADIINDLV